MSWADRIQRAVRGLLPRRLPVWQHRDYRLPVPELAVMSALEPRRSDLALWGLLGAGNRRALAIHEADRIAYGHLGLVHTRDWLEALTRPETLSQVFGLPPIDTFPVDGVLNTVRRACGGTLAAARHALDHGVPALNLLGGFHHAFPDRGGGLCPVNDVATAIAVLRAEGFGGPVAILDLDAHPPDGTAACVQHDPGVWLGSISGSDWGALPERVDETLLPDADDATYLEALDALLRRMPRVRLAFVLAGADVLRGDAMGMMQLSLDGVCARDRAVAHRLRDTPSVWVPAGGYRPDAWRVLAQSACVLGGPRMRRVPDDLDPVSSRFTYVAHALDPRDLSGESDDEPWFTDADLDPRLGGGHPKMLGYYTEEGIEYALHAFGLLPQIRRLGYGHFRVRIDTGPTGDRARLTGVADGETHLLWEVLLDRERRHGLYLLALQWMTMRHPLGGFPPGRPPLPGQDTPGLGLASEAVHLLEQVVDRLRLDGIVYRPAWYHTARMAIPPFRFEDLDEQARFDALSRDLGHLPLAELSRAVGDQRVLCNGEPWTWPAAPMLHLTEPQPHPREALAERTAAYRFSLAGQAVLHSAPTPAA